MPAELDEYRAQADRFLAELYEEQYLQASGQKADLELEPIYERHSDLASETACRELGGLAAAPGAGWRELELWRFAFEGRIGKAGASEEEQIANQEATLEADVDGVRLAFRDLRPAIANEPDRDRRARLDAARLELSEQMNPLRAELLHRAREVASELVDGTIRDLYTRAGLPLEPLAAQCERFLVETEELHAEAFDRLLRRRLGLGLDDARRYDLPRLLRSTEWDPAFPADRMLPALEATLGDLGVELRGQRNVVLDLESRPGKDPRAFCAPIEVPGRVVLCIKPIGGIDDWLALFHEAGHTEHFAHTSSRLPFEARRLGDNAVSETWAFMLEHLVTDPAWLARRLDVGRGDELEAESATARLFYLRRYCAKLLYELELHGGASLDAMPDRYAELMFEATRLDYSPRDYLSDVDFGFYVTAYLRAWALEAQLADHLRAEHGRAWFASRQAGSLLRELWSEGQGMDADAIASEVTGHRVELSAVGEAIAAALGA